MHAYYMSFPSNSVITGKTWGVEVNGKAIPCLLDNASQDIRDPIQPIKLPHMKMGLMIQFLRTTIEKTGVFYLEIGGTNVFARELVDRR